MGDFIFLSKLQGCNIYFNTKQKHAYLDPLDGRAWQFRVSIPISVSDTFLY